MDPAADGPETIRAEELEAAIREVRERVRARYPQTSAGPVSVPLVDLMPAVRARDAAEAKVAAIGSVNPRPPGPLNALIQGVKKRIARALHWHIRDQVEFNRAVVASVDALIEAVNEVNRSLVRVGEHLGELRQGAARLEAEAARLEAEAAALADIRHHWAEWRAGWEYKLARNEREFLRGLAELNGSFHHIEAGFRETVRLQHSDFEGALARATLEARLHYERLIHAELRLVRQRAEAPAPSREPAPSSAPQPASAGYDALAFAARFRGSVEHVQRSQRFYLPYFAGRRNVLDIGCGRGEFLGLLRDAGVPARGIDLDPESVAICRAQGLAADEADLFAFLAALPPGSLDGIFCAQVVEHLPPGRLPDFAGLAAAALAPGGLLVVETPNPECLAIFAVHFYLDPTHTRPIPHPLLVFYLEEAGFGAIEVHKLSPALESMPEVAGLPAPFRDRFFGGLDYAVIGHRL